VTDTHHLNGVEDDMKLPADKTCGDCRNIKRCQILFGCPTTNRYCDWSPHRFRERTPTVHIHIEQWRPTDG
jgi:hypothetical protein